VSTTGTDTPPVEADKQAPGQPKQRLSTSQMLHLMRLEMDRALRHGYPISALVLGLDGFDEEHHLPWRRALMPVVFQELKAVTFENDIRGLGVWTERFQVAIFPHVTPDRLLGLAQDLITRATASRPPEIPADVEISCSAGIAHNLHPGPMSFETLIEEAETGMGLAQNAGGGRVVQAREVERELDKLRDEVDGQVAELRALSQGTGDESETRAEKWAQELVAKVLELFQREPEQSEGILRVQREVVALLKVELGEWRAMVSAGNLFERQRQVEMLERRVAKLTESLGLTEAELKRVAALKNIDLGVASIYRTVQGLSSEEANAEQKKEMLKNIFDANVALRQQIDSSKK
jgi:GGDEF domain-containing protein